MPRTERFTEVQIERGQLGEPLTPGVLRLITNAGAPVRVEFLCPCDCGACISLHVKADRYEKVGDRTYWKYTPGPTLEPSVRWDTSCRAHFTIVAGVVSWE